MASSSFPSPPPWTPPPLQSLNFSAAPCDLVLDFWETWFRALDIRFPSDPKTSNPFDLPWSQIRNPRWFVADSLDSAVVDRYFRNALSSNVASSSDNGQNNEKQQQQQQPTAGQIIDWELGLRREYARQRDEEAPRYLELLDKPDREGDDDEYDRIAMSFKPEYFDIILESPGDACNWERCFSYRPARLSDVNGPGVIITYWAQMIMMLGASILIITRLISFDRRRLQQQKRQLATKEEDEEEEETTKPSSSSKAAEAAIRAMTPLVQTLTMFSLTTSYVLAIQYANKGPHYFPPIDRSVALCSCGLSLVMVLWAWRLNASIEFLSSPKKKKKKNGTTPVSTTTTMPVPVPVPLKSFPLLVFLALIPVSELFSWLRFRGPYDAYGWDYFIGGTSVCEGVDEGQHPGMTITTNKDFIRFVEICGFVRVVFNEDVFRRLLEVLVPWRRWRVLSRLMMMMGGGGRQKDGEEEAVVRLDGDGGSRDKGIDIDPDTLYYSEVRDREHVILGCTDLIIGLSFGVSFTVAFTIYSHSITFLSVDFGIDQWDFGQFLALTTLIPIFLEFWNSWDVFPTKNGNTNIFSMFHAWKKDLTVLILARLEIWLNSLGWGFSRLCKHLVGGRQGKHKASTQLEPLNGTRGYELGSYSGG